jgi:hypothetical protein
MRVGDGQSLKHCNRMKMPSWHRVAPIFRTILLHAAAENQVYGGPDRLRELRAVRFDARSGRLFGLASGDVRGS